MEVHPSSRPTRAHWILFVQDQERSRGFFESVLGIPPSLHVPGMTEFTIAPNTVLGLMPESGIQRLLALDHADFPPRDGLRGELYLSVQDPAACHQRALSAGARELSGLAARDWGDEAAYSVESNGYVLAFARQLPAPFRPSPRD